MRTLILMRHAKSSWDGAELSDHERPLNKRGTRDAPRMAEYIEKRGWLPDVVLCSDAVRTRATLALMRGAIGRWSPEVRFEARLYLAEPAAIIEVLSHSPQEVRRVMVLAHNPGVHALALGLVGSGDQDDLAALAMGFPTAGLAVVELPDIPWRDIEPGKGRLVAFVSPRTV